MAVDPVTALALALALATAVGRSHHGGQERDTEALSVGLNSKPLPFFRKNGARAVVSTWD